MIIFDEFHNDPVLQLASYFVINITNKQMNNETRIHNAYGAIQRMLQAGWTLETIKVELDKFKAEYPTIVENVYHVEEILGNKKPPHNLMDPDIFYYHNRLRVTSNPSRLVLNKETREYERVEEPFFLEMIPCFTMDDLLDYWYESNHMRTNESIIKKDTGRFEYLFGFYDLDEILFAIDVAQEERKKWKQRPLTNAFQLERYIEQARDDIKMKQNEHKKAGINHVIPRMGVV